MRSLFSPIGFVVHWGICPLPPWMWEFLKAFAFRKFPRAFIWGTHHESSDVESYRQVPVQVRDLSRFPITKPMISRMCSAGLGFRV